MVKSRMTALDVRATVEEMRSSLVGLRLLNLYDLAGGKTFLFKFGHGDNKKTVLLENGVRMHLTALQREKPKLPSQFTLKIRKHIRSWRLDSITQLSHDRTIDMCFGVSSGFNSNNNNSAGTDENGGGGHTSSGICFHIIIELFAKGNVILTDSNYSIMMLLRTHKDADVKLMVREQYPFSAPIATIDATTHETDEEQARERREVLWNEWSRTLSQCETHDTTKTILSGVHHFGPTLAEHILFVSGEPMNTKHAEVLERSEELFEKLLPAMLEAWNIALTNLEPGGFLITLPTGTSRRGKNKAAAAAAGAAQTAVEGEAATATVPANEVNVNVTAAPTVVSYDDFSPILLAQYKQPGIVSAFLPSFGAVCDAFFLKSETDKIDQHNDKKKEKVGSKRERFERDHQRRISALQQEEEKNRLKGEAIMLNADKIDEAIHLINGALATGIQWDSLKMLLRRRHAEGHPVAYMIHHLHLERNAMTVLLEQELYDDEDDGDIPSMEVEIDLGKTAHANATDYFTRKKKNKEKLERTVAATDVAAAGAARKADRTAAKTVSKKDIVVERAKYWWEKFLWFRTSAGDVVLRGKDQQTTEILLRRVLLPGDIIVGCEEDGALPCVVRSLGGGGRVACSSVTEAGGYCVSLSSAWTRKQSVGSWWVHAHQLSGGTAAGQYLFDGEKNHMTPQPLSLGCALLFFMESPIADAAVSPGPALAKTDEGSETAEGNGGEYISIDLERPLQPIETVEEMWNRQKKKTRDLQEQRQGRAMGNNNNNTHVSVAESSSNMAEGSSAGGAPEHDKNKKKNKKNKNHSTGAPSKRIDANKVAAANEARTKAEKDGGGAHEAETKPLTKHQQKKLKRIRAKYGDQDDEDRMLGAQINGNTLARVQRKELEKAAARARDEEDARIIAEKKERERLKKKGVLRYSRPVDGAEMAPDDGDEESEGVEVVSEFSDDGGGGAAGEQADVHVDPQGDKEGEKEGGTDAAAEVAENGEKDLEAELLKIRQAEEEARLQCKKKKEEEHQKAKAEKEEAEREKLARIRADTRAAAVEQDKLLRSTFPHYSSSFTTPGATDEGSGNKGNTVQHMIGVCAPLSVVFPYPYRVELVHSVASKKGQVANAVLDHFRKILLPPTAGDEGAVSGLKTAFESIDMTNIIEQIRADSKPNNLKMTK